MNPTVSFLPTPAHRSRSARAVLVASLLALWSGAGSAEPPTVDPQPLLALAPLSDGSEIRPIREPRLVVVRLPVQDDGEPGGVDAPALGSTFAVLVALIAWITLRRA